MDTNGDFFKEWVKPIAKNIFSGLLFVMWWGWTQKDEADKEAKANIFSFRDAEQQRKIEFWISEAHFYRDKYYNCRDEDSCD